MPFPHLAARDLEGRDVVLPEAFDGDRNVVIIAFHRRHQALVDSWVPWLADRRVQDPGLCFFELPAIARIWAPARPMIDGGMAAAIRDPVGLRRTLTVYGDVGRLARALGITSRSTIVLLVVDRAGEVHWSGSGSFSPETAAEMDAALQTL